MHIEQDHRSRGRSRSRSRGRSQETRGTTPLQQQLDAGAKALNDISRNVQPAPEHDQTIDDTDEGHVAPHL
jgi:hypothetical protein